jgi:Tfp pilus assembly protein PilV
VQENDPEAGLTMIEVVVSLTVMTVLMLICTTGLLQVYRSVNATESISTAAAQVNTAFLRLDKEIRYASGISTPGVVSGNPYVEFETANTGTTVCTELRLNVTAHQLQRRSWPQGGSPGSWLPMASQVSASTPFTVSPADSTMTSQRLRVRLVATAGTGGSTATARTDVTFTAMNTSLATTSDTVCSEGRTTP